LVSRDHAVPGGPPLTLLPDSPPPSAGAGPLPLRPSLEQLRKRARLRREVQLTPLRRQSVSHGLFGQPEHQGGEGDERERLAVRDWGISHDVSAALGAGLARAAAPADALGVRSAG
jgi:hypothetical protein